MGTPSGCQTLAWALLGLLSLQKAGKAEASLRLHPPRAAHPRRTDGRRAPAPFVQEKLGPLRMSEGARLGVPCPQEAGTAPSSGILSTLPSMASLG